tara:strand:- start:1524 stop:2537 length:1014 start_codon:yes stop_codon:yes gene_type:complete
MKIFDLFAGVGGFRLGAKKAFDSLDIKHKFVGWSEIDPYCQKTYKANFNVEEEFFVDDIRNATEHKNKKPKLPNFDLLLAGFPCQSFSSMGNANSLDDPRGVLFYQILKVLNSSSPSYFILENVRRILTIDNGKTFETIINSLNSMGYHTNHLLLNSKDYGVPQNRRRVFIFGRKKSSNISLEELIPKRSKSLRVYKNTRSLLSKKVSKKYILSKKILKTIMSDGTGGYQYKSEIDLDIARPLTRTMVKMHRASQDNYYSNQFFDEKEKYKWTRKLTPKEAFRLQGFPSYRFVNNAMKKGVSEAQLYMQAGNAVTVNVVASLIAHLAEIKWFDKITL